MTGSKDQHLDPVMVQISHFWENSTLFGYFASPTLMLTICSLSAVMGTAQTVENPKHYPVGEVKAITDSPHRVGVLLCCWVSERASGVGNE